MLILAVGCVADEKHQCSECHFEMSQTVEIH
jgi:hypothetical protein